MVSRREGIGSKRAGRSSVKFRKMAGKCILKIRREKTSSFENGNNVAEEEGNQSGKELLKT